jgi:hypothetical protein
MYRLKSQTIEIIYDNGSLVTIALPTDAAVKLIGEGLPDGSIDVLWNDHRVNISRDDLKRRGQVIEQKAQGAGS